MRRREAVQLELRAKTWGGKRKGGGRPRTTGWVSRKARPEFPKRYPLHITLRIRRDVGNLRTHECFAEIQRAFLGGHNQFGMRLVEFSVQPDHIHLFVSIPPAIAVANAVKVLKGVSARHLLQRFPALKKRLWGGHLWSPSYYLGTAGTLSATTIERYIERAEQVTKRR